MKAKQVDKMTLQEACDYAVMKIVEQGSRCGDLSTLANPSDMMCEYGNGEGKHCAVGWLLDENEEELMGCMTGVSGLIEYYEELIPCLITENRAVFEQLQGFHDEDEAVKREVRIKRLNELGLDTSAPQYQQWVDMAEVA